MSIQNSTTGEVLRSYSIDELKQQANLMRGYNLAVLCAATSGHAGGTLSIMDITAALYLRVADHDPKNPNWPDRDRIVWSTGHKAPSLYLGPRLRRLLPERKTSRSCASSIRRFRDTRTGSSCPASKFPPDRSARA